MNIFKGEILTHKDILFKYTEEDIFSLALGYRPEEYEILCSPLRNDNNPGCTFRYYNGYLQFLDFGSVDKRGIKKKVAYDCFSFVATYFNIKDEQYLLNFILENLKKNNITETTKEIIRIPKLKREVEITFQTRPYLLWDIKYWTEQYQITMENLYEDKVYPIKSFTSTISNITKHYNFFTLGYAYTDFISGNTKLYFPKDKMRFYTNCRSNDIGGINQIDFSRNTIIITKSYKDYRVLKNQELNCIWLQNEGAFPDLDLLLPLLNKFEEVIIFFDNDETGKNISDMLYSILNSYLESTVRQITLKGTDKDPSDFLKNKGQNELRKFLITNKVK